MFQKHNVNRNEDEVQLKLMDKRYHKVMNLLFKIYYTEYWEMDEESNSIRAGWMKWIGALGVLCEQHLIWSHKGWFYRMVTTILQ